MQTGTDPNKASLLPLLHPLQQPLPMFLPHLEADHPVTEDGVHLGLLLKLEAGEAVAEEETPDPDTESGEMAM